MEFEFFNGNNFWKRPSRYKPGRQLTEEIVMQVEEVLHKKLPASYLRHMYEQNGGELTYSTVRFDDGDVASIPYLHELDVESGVGLSPVFVEAYSFSNDIVLLSGDLDCWFALDYRNDALDPAVIYIYQVEEQRWEEHTIAKNFDSFTKKLFK